MKKLLSALALVAAISFTAHAQKSGIYILDSLDGGTNAIAAGSTNNYAQFAGDFRLGVVTGDEPIGTPILNCQEYTNVAFTVSCTSTNPAATGTVTLRFARSYDGGTTFEATPSFSIALQLNGTNQAVMLSIMTVMAETHVELVSAENPTAYNVTGLRVVYNLKTPKFGAREATQ